MLKINDLIISEEEDFVAINKPSGLLTINDREGKAESLKQMLRNKYGEIFTVHRLDRDTSGLVIFAKNAVAHKYLSQQFENRLTHKTYVGFVIGTPLEKDGIIEEPIAEHPFKKGVMSINKKGKESITHYKTEEQFRLFSWMSFTILTGRTHQIRVHMKHEGHPLVCDDVYGDGKPVYVSQLKKKYNLSKDLEDEKPILNRLALHSSQLGFNYMDGRSYLLEAPLPKDLSALLNQLRKNK